MSVLQEQVVKKVSGLSEADLLFINDMIDRFMKPEKKMIWKQNVSV